MEAEPSAHAAAGLLNQWVLAAFHYFQLRARKATGYTPSVSKSSSAAGIGAGAAGAGDNTPKKGGAAATGQRPGALNLGAASGAGGGRSGNTPTAASNRKPLTPNDKSRTPGNRRPGSAKQGAATSVG